MFMFLVHFNKTSLYFLYSQRSNILSQARIHTCWIKTYVITIIIFRRWALQIQMGQIARSVETAHVTVTHSCIPQV